MPRFFIRKPRYINGVYHFASSEYPAEVEIPEGTKIDAGLIPVEKIQNEGPLKPAHVPFRSSHEAGGLAPTAPAPASADAGGKAKRAADKSPV